VKRSSDYLQLIYLPLIPILWAAVALLGYFEVLVRIQKMVAGVEGLTSFDPIATNMNLVGFSIFVCFAGCCCIVTYYLYIIYTRQEGFNRTLTEMNTQVQDQQQILRQLLRTYYAEKPLSLTEKPLTFQQKIKESECI